MKNNNECDYCPTCNGSGEGMYDGSTCPTCGGCGQVIDQNEQDDFMQEWEYDDDY